MGISSSGFAVGLRCLSVWSPLDNRGTPQKSPFMGPVWVPCELRGGHRLKRFRV